MKTTVLLLVLVGFAYAAVFKAPVHKHASFRAQLIKWVGNLTFSIVSQNIEKMFRITRRSRKIVSTIEYWCFPFLGKVPFPISLLVRISHEPLLHRSFDRILTSANSPSSTIMTICILHNLVSVLRVCDSMNRYSNFFSKKFHIYGNKPFQCKTSRSKWIRAQRISGWSILSVRTRRAEGPQRPDTWRRNSIWRELAKHISYLYC